MTPLQKIKTRPYLFKALIVVAAVGLGFAISAPFFLTRSGIGFDGRVVRQIPLTHDLIQHIAVMQDFDKGLRYGDPYPRWLPDVNGGYGLAWMNYYPPLFFYITSLLHTLDSDWVNMLFLISVLGFAGSGLAFYLLARLFYSRLASIIAGALYMLLPFHVTELYWRGAMPQFLGYVFLPLVLYFGFQVGRGGKIGHYLGLALSYSFYMMMHPPTCLLMSYAMAFYGVVWAFRQRDWKIALRIGAGMALGLLLASVYIVPAALEAKDMQEHFSTIFPYHNSYISLLPGDDFVTIINLSFVGQVVIAMVAAFILRPAKFTDGAEGEKTVADLQTRMWVLLSLTTLFMCTSFSIYISKLLPRIVAASFPWRWLSVTSLFTALAAAAAFDRLRQRGGFSTAKLWAYRLALVAPMVASLLFMAFFVVPGALAHQSHLQPYTYMEAGFTPKGAAWPHNLPNTDEVVLTPEDGSSEIIRWEPERREVKVTTKEPSTVRLKTYNFVGWSAHLDGQPVPLLSDSNGVQMVEVPAGSHRIEVIFHTTRPRKTGALMTGFAFLIIAGLAVVALFQQIQSSNHKHQTLESAERDRRARLTGRIVVLGLALLVGIIVVVIAASLFRAKNQSAGVNSPAGDSSPSAGTRLQIPGLSQIMVAADSGALDELMNALPSGDAQQVENLVAAGKVFRVTNGTRVQVLERNSAKVKVLILDGPDSNKEGWVPERWIQ